MRSMTENLRRSGDPAAPVSLGSPLIRWVFIHPIRGEPESHRPAREHPIASGRFRSSANGLWGEQRRSWNRRTRKPPNSDEDSSLYSWPGGRIPTSELQRANPGHPRR